MKNTVYLMPTISLVILVILFGAKFSFAQVYRVGPTANSCDGICNYYGTTQTAIQNAVNAASGTGDDVYIYNGTYTINAPIDIINRTGTSTNRWYFGGAPGQNNVVLDVAQTVNFGSSTLELAIIRRGAYTGTLSYLEIANFKLQRLGAAQSGSAIFGIGLNGTGASPGVSENIEYHDLEIDMRNNASAMIFRQTSNHHIHHCTLKSANIQYVFRTYFPKNLLIEYSYLEGTNISTAIVEDADGSSGSIYRFNYFYKASGSAGDLIYFKDNGGNIATFYRNILRGTGSEKGFYVGYDGNYSNANRITIAYNTIVGVDYGINVGNACEVHIHGNIFDASTAGIISQYGAQSCTGQSYTYGNNIVTSATVFSQTDSKGWVNNGGNVGSASINFEASGDRPLPYYRIKAGSGAIDRGETTRDYWPDINMISSPSGTPDAGASELSSYPTTPKIGRRNVAQGSSQILPATVTNLTVR